MVRTRLSNWPPYHGPSEIAQTLGHGWQTAFLPVRQHSLQRSTNRSCHQFYPTDVQSLFVHVEVVNVLLKEPSPFRAGSSQTLALGRPKASALLPQSVVGLDLKSKCCGFESHEAHQSTTHRCIFNSVYLDVLSFPCSSALAALP